MKEKAVQVCKNMFFNYSSLQEDVEIKFESEYDDGIFTMSLIFGQHEINGIEVDFNEQVVYLNADHTVYRLGEFDKNTLEFERYYSFFEILFLQII